MGEKSLGKTGETYCVEWLKDYLYKRRPDIKSKFIEKGNSEEESGFTLMATELNLGMVYKNTDFFSNSFMCGTPDLIIGDTVYDNKCAWSLATFPMFKSECDNKMYEFQLQSYMELTGCAKAVLAYTLIDAPVNLVERETKWLTSPDDVYRKIHEMVYTKTYFDELCEHLCPTCEKDYFVEIPEEKRIKTFEFQKDSKIIEKMEQRVNECRKFIKTLI